MVLGQTKRGWWRVARNELLFVSTLAANRAGIAQEQQHLAFAAVFFGYAEDELAALWHVWFYPSATSVRLGDALN
jgi:hypothetical protein